MRSLLAGIWYDESMQYIDVDKQNEYEEKHRKKTSQDMLLDTRFEERFYHSPSRSRPPRGSSPVHKTQNDYFSKKNHEDAEWNMDSAVAPSQAADDEAASIYEMDSVSLIGSNVPDDKFEADSILESVERKTAKRAPSKTGSVPSSSRLKDLQRSVRLTVPAAAAGNESPSQAPSHAASRPRKEKEHRPVTRMPSPSRGRRAPSQISVRSESSLQSARIISPKPFS
jgi:hypothetical protein